ncbi:PAS domain-containing sensor histidine kinase [Desulforhabdus sp. TSK]|uniref:sensor histidine kinase n=1 Tax=Desulforhabdus sp. TSK TaxID=2925014 RepID=UPI001FC8CBC2|nr:ATP-binding protein [Desulforhabdus sp. TSK]GKT10742.1 sensor histidine kinase [Desulforhabdus sp. TSK]
MNTANENMGGRYRSFVKMGAFLKEYRSRALDEFKRDSRPAIKLTTIEVLVVVTTILHYHTKLGARHFHVFYQGLYFLPVILSGFWFGLKGGLITSVTITLLYTPFTIMHWNGFSSSDLTNLMEMVLYNSVASMLGIMRDREQAKHKQLVESERLAAMGSAVSCLAHDMKTPLIAIGGFARLVQKQVSRECHCDPSPYVEKLDIVVKETQRLENMVKDMLDFARPLELNRAMEDVGNLIKGSLLVAEGEARKRGVILHVPSDSAFPLVPLDAVRMEQVLINLVTNAIQASPEGSTVAVDARAEGSRLIIDVSDNGCGIPVEKREEVFRPFVSMKKEGTGLGLPIVKKIVEAHEGRVEILDNSGGGITFRLLIPMK